MTDRVRVDIDVNVKDVDRLVANFERATGEMSLFEFLRTSVEPFIRHRTEQRFAEEGDEASRKWRELRVATQNIRETEGYPPDHPINVRSGDLLEFVTGSGLANPTTLGAELQFPSHEASGSLLEKFKTAQQGNVKQVTRGFQPTPARPVLVLGEFDLLSVMEMLKVWIVADASGGFVVAS